MSLPFRRLALIALPSAAAVALSWASSGLLFAQPATPVQTKALSRAGTVIVAGPAAEATEAGTGAARTVVVPVSAAPDANSSAPVPTSSSSMPPSTAPAATGRSSVDVSLTPTDEESNPSAAPLAPLRAAPTPAAPAPSVATAPSQSPGTALPLQAPTRMPTSLGLPVELSQALRASGLPPDQVGLVAIEVSEGKALAAWNAEQPFNPASTMKLVTTYAALSMLGADYRWRTRAYLNGRLQGDVLMGDLILKGGGDPKLVIEDLTEFVGRMRAAGLREIRGDLLLDDSIYLPESRNTEAIDGDPSQPYNVKPYGLLMNFKAARVVAQPNGKHVSFTTDPPLADIDIDNAVTVSPGKCRFGANGLVIRDGGSDARPQIKVNGPYSPSCGEQGTFAAVLTHRQFIHSIFKAAWLASGGSWAGQTRVSPGSAKGKPWLEWVSPRTLADVVQDVNKFSNNVMARQLLLQTAAENQRGKPASVEQARALLSTWLDSRGLRFPELVIENGSGLSRNERISPQHLAELLRQVAVSDVGDIMRGSLPRVGVDGTMRNRLLGQPIVGHAWIKTGSLNDVRAVAGYVDAAGGKRYAIAMLINGPRAETSMRALDSFLNWVYENG